MHWYYNETVRPENLDMTVASEQYEYESASNTSSNELIIIEKPISGNTFKLVVTVRNIVAER